MYTTINFKTKKELREAVATGKTVTVFQPGPFSNPATPDGAVYLEGPHYPTPHTWYAKATIKDGIVVKIK